MKDSELASASEILGQLLKKKEAAASSAAGKASDSKPSLWKGAEVARGYTDITSIVDFKGLDLLNSDDAPRKLLSETKPSALESGKAASSAEAESKDWVQSSVDQQLMLYTPFNSIVKLHTIQITSIPPKEDNGEDEVTRPRLIHVYINQPHNLDFNEADDLPPAQAITLSAKDWNEKGTANIPLRFVKFQKVTSLVLYVVEGDGDAEITRIDRIRYIGEEGESRKVRTLEKIEDH
ncbi:hypothetical protein BROUX41_006332 [Berkeleyomyces rouxiae]